MWGVSSTCRRPGRDYSSHGRPSPSSDIIYSIEGQCWVQEFGSSACENGPCTSSDAEVTLKSPCGGSPHSPLLPLRATAQQVLWTQIQMDAPWKDKHMDFGKEGKRKGQADSSAPVAASPSTRGPASEAPSGPARARDALAASLSQAVHGERKPAPYVMIIGWEMWAGARFVSEFDELFTN